LIGLEEEKSSPWGNRENPPDALWDEETGRLLSVSASISEYEKWPKKVKRE
jgi:hypothetical protein